MAVLAAEAFSALLQESIYINPTICYQTMRYVSRLLGSCLLLSQMSSSDKSLSGDAERVLEDIHALKWKDTVIDLGFEDKTKEGLSHQVKNSFERNTTIHEVAHISRKDLEDSLELIRREKFGRSFKVHIYNSHTHQTTFSNVRILLHHHANPTLFSYRWPKGVKSATSSGNL